MGATGEGSGRPSSGSRSHLGQASPGETRSAPRGSPKNPSNAIVDASLWRREGFDGRLGWTEDGGAGASFIGGEIDGAARRSGQGSRRNNLKNETQTDSGRNVLVGGGGV